MPTYQYHCTDCDDDFEIQQKFTDAALTSCPSCEGHLRKVFSPVGVVFKGSGFYATDNRTKGKSNASSPGEGASSEAKPAAQEKKSESTSDAKPAKSDAKPASAKPGPGSSASPAA